MVWPVALLGLAAAPLWIRRIAWAGCDTAQKLDRRSAWTAVTPLRNWILFDFGKICGYVGIIIKMKSIALSQRGFSVKNDSYAGEY